jgi:hypothetical protein
MLALFDEIGDPDRVRQASQLSPPNGTPKDRHRVTASEDGSIERVDVEATALLIPRVDSGVFASPAALCFALGRPGMRGAA